MSREIKFRAGFKRKNELIYLKGFRYSGNEKIKITFEDEDKDDCTYTFLNKDVCLEQFTGLHDKNGVEIFEGDIVHCISRFDDAKMVVIFEDGEFRMVLLEKIDSYVSGGGFYALRCFDKEVIGNIHERRMGDGT